MNQYDIETFLAIVHSCSFSKAASLMFTTQATVSHRIGMLEKELGYLLFVRNQGLRKVALTYQGEQFVPLAEQWASLWNTSRSIRDSNYRQPLIVGANNRLNTHFLTGFYDHFARKQPDIVLDIRSYHSTEIFDLIGRNVLDIGFVSNVITMDNVVAASFLCEHIVMVCHCGNYYVSGSIHPGQLNISDEVHLAANQHINAWHDLWWDKTKQPYLYADTASLIAHLLREPKLWAVCPLSVANELCALFPLEIHEFSVDVPQQVSSLLYHQTPRMEKKAVIHNFVNSFREYYSEAQIEGFCF